MRGVSQESEGHVDVVRPIYEVASNRVCRNVHPQGCCELGCALSNL